MNRREIAEGIKLYKFHQKAFFLVLSESILVSAIIGFWLGSFTFFLLAFVALFVLARFRIFAWLITIIFSVGWGFIGFIIGSTFGLMPIYIHNILGFALGILFFIISYRIHVSSYGIR